jgi:hypothetical protein
MQLVAGNALLAGNHEIDSLEPITQRDMAGLKYGVDRHPELLPAGVTLVNARPRSLPLEQPIRLASPQ